MDYLLNRQKEKQQEVTMEIEGRLDMETIRAKSQSLVLETVNGESFQVKYLIFRGGGSAKFC